MTNIDSDKILGMPLRDLEENPPDGMELYYALSADKWVSTLTLEEATARLVSLEALILAYATNPTVYTAENCLNVMEQGGVVQDVLKFMENMEKAAQSSSEVLR